MICVRDSIALKKDADVVWSEPSVSTSLISPHHQITICPIHAVVTDMALQPHRRQVRPETKVRHSVCGPERPTKLIKPKPKLIITDTITTSKNFRQMQPWICWKMV